MNFINSRDLKRLLAQPVVTACGHVEEGPSADKRDASEFRGSRMGVSRHWIIRMPEIPKR
jgi:hypothetical protein